MKRKRIKEPKQNGLTMKQIQVYIKKDSRFIFTATVVLEKDLL